jgi:hypothetical protein
MAALAWICIVEGFPNFDETQSRNESSYDEQAWQWVAEGAIYLLLALLKAGSGTRKFVRAAC